VIPVENLLFIVAILILVSVIASKASGVLGVPALLLFLVIGMLAGSEGPGGIYFDDPWLAQLVGVIALTFILFDGGLRTQWRVIRPVFTKGFSLSSLGVLLSAIAVGAFATLFLNFSLLEGFLLGAIVSSTDAAAVFSILRSRDVSLKGDLEPLLELESGSNDPMAVFLTLGFTQLLIEPQRQIFDLVPFFFQQMGLGVLLGLGFGRVIVEIVNRLNLGYVGLYPVFTFSMVLLGYGATASLGGNGFLAVYLAGLVMRNHDFIHRRSIMRFHDGLAWILQITMFLALGLLVFPSQLIPVIGTGLIISAVLIFVARPLSVFASLALTRMNIREKFLVSWVGLRGAAPIILATFPLVEGVPHADAIFHLVFFIVLTSVVLQGTSIMPVARWLQLDAPLTVSPRAPLEYIDTPNPDSDLVEIEVVPGSGVVGKKIVDLRLPNGALVVLIGSVDRFIIPSGGTTLQAGDRLIILADRDSLEQVRAILDSNQRS
jgi:potassium/hydrogen antiporter